MLYFWRNQKYPLPLPSHTNPGGLDITLHKNFKSYETTKSLLPRCATIYV